MNDVTDFRSFTFDNNSSILQYGFSTVVDPEAEAHVWNLEVLSRFRLH